MVSRGELWLLALLLCQGPLCVLGQDPGKPFLTRTMIKGSQCMDTSEAGYYYGTPSSGSSGVWIIDLQGGGGCMGAGELGCQKQAQMTGSSLVHSLHNEFGGENRGLSFTGKRTGGFGPWPKIWTNFTNDYDSGSSGTSTNKPHIFMSTDKEKNPRFHDAHHIHVPYCTGDIYWSNITSTSPEYGTARAFAKMENFSMTGSHNLHLFIDHIVARPEFKSATRILWGGESAGAIGALPHAEMAQAKMKAVAPNAIFKVFSSAGYFTPGIWVGVAGNMTLKSPNFVEGVKTIDFATAKQLVSFYNPYMSPSCVAGMKAMGVSDVYCATIGNVHRFSPIPMFFTQYAFDTSLITHILIGGMEVHGWGPGIWPGEFDWDEEWWTGAADLKDDRTWSWRLLFVRELGRSLVESFRANSKDTDGYFLMGCLEHVGGLGVGGSGGPMSLTPLRRGGPSETLGCGKSPYHALADWFFRESPEAKLDQFIDPCLEKTGTLPCNPTCVAFKALQQEDGHCPFLGLSNGADRMMSLSAVALLLGLFASSAVF